MGQGSPRVTFRGRAPVARLGQELLQAREMPAPPPLRFAAGADAVVGTVEKKTKDLLAQAGAYRELSSSLAHDDDVRRAALDRGL